MYYDYDDDEDLTQDDVDLLLDSDDDGEDEDGKDKDGKGKDGKDTEADRDGKKRDTKKKSKAKPKPKPKPKRRKNRKGQGPWLKTNPALSQQLAVSIIQKMLQAIMGGIGVYTSSELFVLAGKL